MRDADEQPSRRRSGLLMVGGSMLAALAVVIVVVMGVGLHRAKTTAVPTQPSVPSSVPSSVLTSVLTSVPAAVSPVPSFYPPPTQSAVDGHLGAMYATQILQYTPYVGDVPRPDLVITATDSSMESAIDPSLDCTAVSHDLGPLRCISPNGPIYDPCFPNLEASSCLFVASPAATDAVRVLLGPPTQPQPTQAIVSPNLAPGDGITTPWALDLTDGTECVFEHGAEDNVGGLRPNYRCSDGRFVFGNPDEAVSGWSVQLGASQSGPLTAKIGVTDAWIFANR
jgi:hypothetical protein